MLVKNIVLLLCFLVILVTVTETRRNTLSIRNTLVRERNVLNGKEKKFKRMRENMPRADSN